MIADKYVSDCTRLVFFRDGTYRIFVNDTLVKEKCDEEAEPLESLVLEQANGTTTVFLNGDPVARLHDKRKARMH